MKMSRPDKFAAIYLSVCVMYHPCEPSQPGCCSVWLHLTQLDLPAVLRALPCLVIINLIMPCQIVLESKESGLEFALLFFVPPLGWSPILFWICWSTSRCRRLLSLAFFWRRLAGLFDSTPDFAVCILLSHMIKCAAPGGRGGGGGFLHAAIGWESSQASPDWLAKSDEFPAGSRSVSVLVSKCKTVQSGLVVPRSNQHQHSVVYQSSC